MHNTSCIRNRSFETGRDALNSVVYWSSHNLLSSPVHWISTTKWILRPRCLYWCRIPDLPTWFVPCAKDAQAKDNFLWAKRVLILYLWAQESCQNHQFCVQKTSFLYFSLLWESNTPYSNSLFPLIFLVQKIFALAFVSRKRS